MVPARGSAGYTTQDQAAVKDEAGESNYKNVARKDSDPKNDASSNSCVR
jgi:hypothetical protein